MDGNVPYHSSHRCSLVSHFITMTKIFAAVRLEFWLYQFNIGRYNVAYVRCCVICHSLSFLHLDWVCHRCIFSLVCVLTPKSRVAPKKKKKSPPPPLNKGS